MREMQKALHALPGLFVALAGIAMLAWGPIPQLPHYHEFADQHVVWGVPHAFDVLSNVPFALVGAWALWRARGRPASPEGPARTIFFLALLATAAGSSYYHWAPDNARLVFDRLPIAIACAALLCAMHARIHRAPVPGLLAGLLIVAVGSVLWWAWTESMGRGDLRPYLLLQFAPLVLVPLWQWIHREPAAERWGFGLAIALYAAAKVFELQDHAVLEFTGGVSGHTVKHLLAAAAGAVLCRGLLR